MGWVDCVMTFSCVEARPNAPFLKHKRYADRI
jgi:hypothetical protein